MQFVLNDAYCKNRQQKIIKYYIKIIGVVEITSRKSFIIWLISLLTMIAAIVLIVVGHFNKFLLLEITGESLLTLDIAFNITVNIKIDILIRKNSIKNVDGPVGISDSGDVNFNYNNVITSDYSRDIDLVNDEALKKALYNVETNIKCFNHNNDNVTIRIHIKKTIAANYNVISNSRYQFNDYCLKDLFSKILNRVTFFHDIDDREVAPAHMEYYVYKQLTDELLIWISHFYKRVTEIAK